MPLKDHITRPLLSDHFYHIYNRGNMENDLFFKEENYLYFLKKYGMYMMDYWETYAYALIPNHFHLAIRVKSEEVVLAAAVRDLRVLRKDKWEQLLRKVRGRGAHAQRDLPVLRELANLAGQVGPPPLSRVIPLLTPDLRTELAAWAVSERFRRFALGYTKAINKQTGRYGSLLQKPFRRKLVADEGHLRRLIAYIHRNGVHHGYVNEIEDYPHCSYHAILSEAPTRLERRKVLELYGGLEGFLRFHGTMPKGGFMNEDFVIEE